MNGNVSKRIIDTRTPEKISISTIPVTKKGTEFENGYSVTSRRETILYVEDEPVLRNLAVRLLNKEGYNVLSAINEAEAISIVEKSGPEKFDLILIDMMMPIMKGKDLADQLAKIVPESKVILMTAAADSEDVRMWIVQRGFAFLQKPVRLEVLLNKIRKVLDASFGQVIVPQQERRIA